MAKSMIKQNFDLYNMVINIHNNTRNLHLLSHRLAISLPTRINLGTLHKPKEGQYACSQTLFDNQESEIKLKEPNFDGMNSLLEQSYDHLRS